uniref:Secreted protein n=1 Tax=Mesocestoides corti TaxID=53468 RepID=A0A5K3G2Z8_MESCO
MLGWLTSLGALGLESAGPGADHHEALHPQQHQRHPDPALLQLPTLLPRRALRGRTLDGAVLRLRRFLQRLGHHLRCALFRLP